MKTKYTNKLLVLIISVIMIATLFVGFSLTAAAAGDVGEGEVASVTASNGEMVGSYHSLEDALAALEKDSTLKLLADITESVYLDSDSFTFDLNGHSITSDYALNIRGKNITVTDSGTEGKIIGSFTAVSLDEDCSCIIAGGLISSDDTGLSLYNNSTCTITGGTIQSEYTGIYFFEGAKCTISGGEIQGEINGLYIDEGGYCTINGGVIFSEHNGVEGYVGNCIINGGTIIGNTSGVYFDSGSCTINGGTIIGDLWTVVFFDGNFNIIGGSFNQDPSEYLTKGYAAIKEGDYWVVTEKPEASLTKNGVTTYYPIIGDALDDAVMAYGSTIKLLSDVTLENGFWIKGGTFIIDLNGHQITYDTTTLTINENTNITITDSSENRTGTLGSIRGTVVMNNGGNCTITGGNISGRLSNSGALVIKGGTFTEDPSVYVPNTHMVTQNAGIYTVSEKPKTYAVTVDISPIGGGTVTANVTEAVAGSTITLTVTPSASYILATLIVTNGETEVEVTNNSFTMPASAVTVSVAFKLCDHTGGNPTCTTSGICKVCGTEYLDPDNHEFDKNSGICCGIYQPATLNEEGYYEIGNAGQLFWFARLVNIDGQTSANAILTADIDLEGRKWYPIGLYNDIAEENGEPTVKQYGGIFDGNGHTVSNFTASGNGSQGLLGYCNGSTVLVKNLGIINATVSGWNAGAVAGYAANMENCYALGCTIIGKSDTNTSGVTVSSLGGNNGSSNSIKNCFAYDCTLIADESEQSYVMHPLGGIKATNNNTCVIQNSYYVGIVAGSEFTNTDNAVEKSIAQLANGEVAYLLGSAFGQEIGKDAYPVLGGTPITEGFSIYGQQLNVGGDLSMKYYVTAFGDGVSAETLTLEFLFLGKKTEVSGVYDSKMGMYVFTLEGINPQCMGDTINATLLLNGVEKASKKEYTVEDNLNNLLEKHPDDAALVALINDILAYGTAASDYKKHDTMSKDYEGSDREIPKTDVALGEAFTGYTVVFGQMNYLKIRVNLAEGQTLYLDGTDVTDKVADGIFKTSGIAPTDFAKKFSFEIKDGDTSVQTFAVSVNDYIAAQKDSLTMGKLVKALYNYGVSAEIYKHVKTGEGEHFLDGTDNCVCGYEITTIDLSMLTETYVINDSEIYKFTGSGSYGIKVESGNPTIILNNANIALIDGDYYSGKPVSGIYIHSTTTILVIGENSITPKEGSGIFVLEGSTVKIIGRSREDVLTVKGTRGSSGIGGCVYLYGHVSAVNCGNIEISNVTIKAFGSEGYFGDVSPAIGAAGNASCGYVIIDNADVYAEGFGKESNTYSSAAIGTGLLSMNNEGGTIGEISIINNSKVYVTKGSYSDYIGCSGTVDTPTQDAITAIVDETSEVIKQN